MSCFTKLLEGHVALVTGAGSGIGAGLAQGIAAHGATVVVTGRKADALRETVAAIEREGGQARAFTVDVSNAASCESLAVQVAEAVGNVSLLVNNAGIIETVRMDEPGVESAWERIIATNLNGPFNMARAFLQQLKATHGSIVNIGSIAGFIYTTNTVGYSASKGGLHMLTVALAKELGKDGIRVNTVAPGAIATPMSPSAGEERRMAALLRRVPLGRIGQPGDLVGPVVFLGSSMASYITGATLVADGGYLTN